MKRIALFLLTNLAVMVVLGIVTSLLGLNRFVGPNGVNVATLMGFSLVVVGVLSLLPPMRPKLTKGGLGALAGSDAPRMAMSKSPAASAPRAAAISRIVWARFCGVMATSVIWALAREGQI